MFGMKTRTRWMLGALALAGMTLTPQAAKAVLIGGVEFPQGAISFADEVTAYSVGGGGVASANQNSSLAVGVPNGPFVSLGDGGSIILRFTNNLLTGSGNSDLDLWIFEVGPDVEDTFVAISKDGINFTDIGKVFGATSGIDIDAFGFGTGDQFAFVRLIDDTNEGQQSGASTGADIDAVGAISTVPVVIDVPEPASLGLLAGGLLLGGLTRTRRRAR